MPFGVYPRGDIRATTSAEGRGDILEPMEPRFSPLQAPALAFFSGAFYHDVARRWRGAGLGYLVAVSVILWAAAAGSLYGGMRLWGARVATPALEAAPTVSIKRGRVELAEPTYLIPHPRREQVYLVLDTSGQYASLEPFPHARLLLTADELIVRRPWSEQVHRLSLGEVDDVELTGEEMLANVRAWTPAIAGAYFAGGFAVGLVYRLVSVSLLALVIEGFAKLQRKPLNYRPALRMAVMVTGCIMILDTLLVTLRNLGVMETTTAAVGVWWGVAAMLMLGYAWFAVAAIREEKPRWGGHTLDGVTWDHEPRATPAGELA